MSGFAELARPLFCVYCLGNETTISFPAFSVVAHRRPPGIGATQRDLLSGTRWIPLEVPVLSFDHLADFAIMGDVATLWICPQDLPSLVGRL